MKILLLALFLLSSCKTPTTKNFNPLDSYFDFNLGGSGSLLAMTEEYMDVVDAHRRNLGLPAFLPSDEIEAEAQAHAENMAKGLAAFGTSGSVDRCARIKTNLGMGELCGEIVAKGINTPGEVFTTWISSDSSRAKLQSTRFTHSAMSVVENAEGVKYWVQIFLEVP
jgi:uncharacterized protein YkwD